MRFCWFHFYFFLNPTLVFFLTVFSIFLNQRSSYEFFSIAVFYRPAFDKTSIILTVLTLKTLFNFNNSNFLFFFLYSFKLILKYYQLFWLFALLHGNSLSKQVYNFLFILLIYLLLHFLLASEHVFLDFSNQILFHLFYRL